MKYVLNINPDIKIILKIFKNHNEKKPDAK